ncbi:hypothetical protein BDR22DRAFT_892492 [Usnea florida]
MPCCCCGGPGSGIGRAFVRFRIQTSRLAKTRARTPRVTPTPIHAMNLLLRSVLACRLAIPPFADVAAVVGIPDDENEIADAEDEIKADFVEDFGVVFDVDVDEIEANIVRDTGVGVDEFVTISAVDVDHVIGERSDLRWFSRSEYSPRIGLVNYMLKLATGWKISEEDELRANGKIPTI